MRASSVGLAGLEASGGRLGVAAAAPGGGASLPLRAPPPRGAARQRRGVGDLVAVELQDRDDGAVPRRVDQLVDVPAGGERAGLGLAVADDAEDGEVGVVESGAIGVQQRVAELAALVK